jgi:hypothetical protein
VLLVLVALGGIVGGPIVPLMQTVPTIVGLCAVYVAVMLGMLLNPALRRMDTANRVISA